MTLLKKRKTKKKSLNHSLSNEEKYQLYEESVQNPEGDLDIINREYRKIFKRKPLILREDFAGTCLLSHRWVMQGNEHRAFAIDLDPVPLEFGKITHSQKLNQSQKERLRMIEANVLDPFVTPVDVAVAFNFSYFIFKERNDLLRYFKAVKNSLGPEGVFIIDLFGGTEAFQILEEKKKHKSFTYYWDCQKYNPLTGECLYYIHFKMKGHKYTKVFVYDWRMWTLPELKDILKDAGFKEVLTFWEGEDGKGGGDGHFYQSREAENCQSWVTYLIAKA